MSNIHIRNIIWSDDDDDDDDDLSYDGAGGNDDGYAICHWCLSSDEARRVRGRKNNVCTASSRSVDQPTSA